MLIHSKEFFSLYLPISPPLCQLPCLLLLGLMVCLKFEPYWETASLYWLLFLLKPTTYSSIIFMLIFMIILSKGFDHLIRDLFLKLPSLQSHLELGDLWKAEAKLEDLRKFQVSMASILKWQHWRLWDKQAQETYTFPDQQYPKVAIDKSSDLVSSFWIENRFPL